MTEERIIMKTMTLEELKKVAKERFGEDGNKWAFVCPVCKTRQTAEDLLAAGVSKEDVSGKIGFSCIGRFTRDKGCDWTLGGLLHLHELEIETPDGKKHMHFDLAEVE